MDTDSNFYTDSTGDTDAFSGASSGRDTGTAESKLTTEDYADQLLRMASDSISENLKFMEPVMERINPVPKRGVRTASLEGDNFYYEPSFLLKKCIADDNFPVRLLLHSLWHAVFRHGFGEERMEAELWDIACDISVENLIMDLDIPDFALGTDPEIRRYLDEIKKSCSSMTAERIYRFLLADPPSEGLKSEYLRLFNRDIHDSWRNPSGFDENEDEWRKISDRLKTEFKVFAQETGYSASLIGNLDEATRQRYDYAKLLGRFCQENESVSVSEDEFDYIYYTYGMTTYDGMPFIEPLELTKERKTGDYVIVLDVSEKFRKEILQGFLKKTYEIIVNSDRYCENVHLHVIRYKEEGFDISVIRNKSELEDFIGRVEPCGSNGTDFRPAFVYVDRLLLDKVFTDFKGVIYFSDRYGDFPARNPGFECITAFVSDESGPPRVPWWATPIVLEEDYLQM